MTNVRASTKIAELSAQMRRDLNIKPRSSDKITANLGALLRKNNNLLLVGPNSTVELLPPPTEVLRASLGASEGAFKNRLMGIAGFDNSAPQPRENVWVKVSMLHSFNQQALPFGKGIAVHYVGDLIFWEFKPKHFAATIFMLGVTSAAQAFKEAGTLPFYPKYTPEQNVYASMLVTYENWLGTSPIKEQIIERDDPMGTVYQFTFVDPIPNARLLLEGRSFFSSPSGSPPRTLH